MITTETKTKKPKTIIFFIDAEKFRSVTRELSVRSLLVDFAKEDPSMTTLALKQGQKLLKFTDLDQIVQLKQGMKFIVFHNEPTPVSSYFK